MSEIVKKLRKMLFLAGAHGDSHGDFVLRLGLDDTVSRAVEIYKNHGPWGSRLRYHELYSPKEFILEKLCEETTYIRRVPVEWNSVEATEVVPKK